MANLDNVIRALRESVTTAPQNYPDRAMLLNDLGNALGERYRRAGDTGDIEEAVQMVQEAVDLIPLTHSDRAGYLASVGTLLVIKYKGTKEINDLLAAIRAAQGSVETIPRDRPDLARVLNFLGTAFTEKYNRTREICDLEEAIRSVQKAIDALPPVHSDRARYLNSLGILFAIKYKRTNEVHDLRASIRAMKEVLDMLPRDHPDRARYLNHIDGFERTGATTDLAAIRAMHVSINATAQYFPERTEAFRGIGSQLKSRYKSTGDIDDLTSAIWLFRQCVDATPRDHPNYAIYLNDLAVQLHVKYKRTEAVDDIKEAIQAAQELVDITPEDSPDRAERLSMLGQGFSDRYKKTGTLGDLEAAFHAAQESVDITPEDSPYRAGRFFLLGQRHSDRYTRTGTMEDLEAALQATQVSVDSTPEDSPDRARSLNTLGQRYNDRYSRTGEMKDLEAALQAVQESVDITTNNHPDRASFLTHLGVRLGDRYMRTGAIEDLEAAVQVAQESVEKTPEGHADRAMVLSNLGGYLCERYNTIGAVGDLEAAIHATQASVDITQEDSPQRFERLNNLGLQLGLKYRRTKAIDDLEASIRVLQESANKMPENHPDPAKVFINLGGQMHVRYTRTRAIQDLEAAIQFTQKSINATSEDHPDRAGRLNNLGAHFSDRYKSTQAPEDLEAAIQAAQESVDTTPANKPGRATSLNNLGAHLYLKYERTGVIDHLKKAISCDQTALSQSSSPTLDRVRAGMDLLHRYAMIADWQQAYNAASTTVYLASKLAARSLDNSDKQHILAQVVGLASNAAAAALNVAKKPLDALNLLEQGRGILATSLEDIRMDVKDLQIMHPSLAQQFIHLREELDQPVSHNMFIEDGVYKSSWPAQANRRYEAGRELDALILNIRQQVGFRDFLLAPSEEDMQAAAKLGPIVVINVSQYRCDAIIVKEREIRLLSLPNLSSEDIRKQGSEGGDLGGTKTLEWLWDAIADPILKELGFEQLQSNDKWPHIWWIPTGPLTKFPLHAAGYHGNHYSSKTVIDRVMSSYSSSIKAIIHGRRQHHPQVLSNSTKALLIAMEDTPAIPSRLPFATSEVAKVRRLCESMQINIVEPERRKEEVTQHLPSCRIFHFAGHGKTNEFNPSQSYLALDDWKTHPLTVATLLDINLRQNSPFLAYLSACGTGQIQDQSYMDESLHLINAFQLAGFRHVLGTLWEVDDSSCVEMASITYGVMKQKGMTDESVCLGLHDAARTLRDRWMTELSNMRDVVLCEDKDARAHIAHWVPYVHLGV
ncbi:hypothetical protein QQS21_001671 [Conoideocrella luteorostrata]|uniref:CHAT domain-containing protein n=1 Tax=Conoideocrella luteorostrata TaxID=1105319 RepID=A0AAJ0CZB8_9HYPO|nr:hypothetical protein QQS21_001671 [Conoideocrella luteorostrata]